MFNLRTDNPLNLKGRVALHRIKLNGGYDSGGTYWGVGQRLYRAEDEEGLTCYIRAVNYREAKLQFSKDVVFSYRLKNCYTEDTVYD
jgi:hypothetical protein